MQAAAVEQPHGLQRGPAFESLSARLLEDRNAKPVQVAFQVRRGGCVELARHEPVMAFEQGDGRAAPG